MTPSIQQLFIRAKGAKGAKVHAIVIPAADN